MRFSSSRISPQKPLPGDRVPGRAGDQRATGVHHARRLAVGVLRLAGSPAVGTHAQARDLAGEIAHVHKDSGATYGALRVTAELRYGRGIVVGHNQVSLIMSRLGLHGLPKRRFPRGAKLGKASSLDLVRRRFSSDGPDRLWMTDITEHHTREGKLYCCAVLDAFSRMVVGWSIDRSQTALLVTSALSMAIARRTPAEGGIIHSDQGTQFGSWAFSQKVRDAGLAPSMGAFDAPFDNAMVEAFWARMQVELLNRHRWRTRVELATAIHDGRRAIGQRWGQFKRPQWGQFRCPRPPLRLVFAFGAEWAPTCEQLGLKQAGLRESARAEDVQRLRAVLRHERAPRLTGPNASPRAKVVVAERLNATVSKTVSGGFPLTRVRIPPPPFFREFWRVCRRNGLACALEPA
jgi:putative transposase